MKPSRPPIARATVLLALAALVGPGALGCYTVAFHPLPDQYAGVPIDARAALFIPEEVSGASHSFRHLDFRIARRWTVPYGQRIGEFAVKTLEAAFRELRPASAPDQVGDSDLLVRLVSADFELSGQSAIVSLHVDARGAEGDELFAKEYNARGSSGFGAVQGEGTFAKKGVIRSSTDEALRVIFGNLLTDLRSALR